MTLFLWPKPRIGNRPAPLSIEIGTGTVMVDTKSEAAAPIYWIARLVDVAATIFRTLERSAGPVVDLVIRLWLAQMFFASAVVKLAHWSDALYLAAHEYPVAWMNPVAAAYLGVSIEFFGAALLAVGLA